MLPRTVVLTLGLIIGFTGCALLNWRFEPASQPHCAASEEAAFWDWMLRDEPPVTPRYEAAPLQRREF